MSLVSPTTADHSPSKDEACMAEHCFFACSTLHSTLDQSVEALPPSFPDEKYPLFVTWNTRSSRAGRPSHLRGCIGNFESLPLHEGLADYALISALKDSRFRPIEAKELESLECSVSFLTNFEDANSYLDWTVGVHGIYITFPHPSLLNPPSSEAPSPLSSGSSVPSITSKRSFSATYLPEVIPDQGWDKIDAVDSAIHKSGWRGPISEDLRRSIKLRRYQSSRCTVTWDEYIEWREAQEA